MAPNVVEDRNQGMQIQSSYVQSANIHGFLVFAWYSAQHLEDDWARCSLLHQFNFISLPSLPYTGHTGLPYFLGAHQSFSCLGVFSRAVPSTQTDPFF